MISMIQTFIIIIILVICAYILIEIKQIEFILENTTAPRKKKAALTTVRPEETNTITEVIEFPTRAALKQKAIETEREKARPPVEDKSPSIGEILRDRILR